MIYRDFESNKLGDMAIGQAGAGHYSWAALSSNDSKTRCVRISNIAIDTSGVGCKKYFDLFI